MPPLNLYGLTLNGSNVVGTGLAYEYTGNGTSLTITRSTEWQGKIRHSFEMVFPSTEDANSYFETESEIRISAVLENPTTHPGRDYQSLLERIGTVIFSLKYATSYGVGSGTTVGFQTAADLTDNLPTTIFNASNGMSDDSIPGLDYGDIHYTIVIIKRSSTAYEFVITYHYDDNNTDADGVDGILTTMVDVKRYIALAPPDIAETTPPSNF